MRGAALLTLAVVALSGCAGRGGETELTTGPTSEGFEFTAGSDVHEGVPVPVRFTCDGEDVSPALAWKGVPEGTQELALVLEDPDAPGGTFTHWLVYGIDPNATSLANESPTEGRNDFGKTGYGGPCPPGGQTHHYVFRLLALHNAVELEEGADRSAFDDAVAPHVLAEARVTATYRRR